MWFLHVGELYFVCFVWTTSAQGIQNQATDVWNPEVQPPIKNLDQQHIHQGYQDPIPDRQGVLPPNLATPEISAIIALALGGAVVFGLGLSDAAIRRETLRSDLDAANARIAALEAKTNAACSNIQGIVTAFRGLGSALAGSTQPPVVPVIPNLREGGNVTPREDILRQLIFTSQDELDAFLNQFFGPLPTSVCT